MPQLDLAQDLGPAQEADPELAPLRRLAEGADPAWRLRDGVLYRVTPIGERLVVPTALRDELLRLHHD